MKDEKIFGVSDITRRIKEMLETGFPALFVQGEISNLKLHTSGHLYFTLKDPGAQISCVMWRSRAGQLPFRPADGMKVIARGKVTVYEPRGNYQLDCSGLQPAGIGELQQAFERLKAKLLEEGLFDAAHKKPLPEYPQRIGVVTSPTGAAIRDIISVIKRRMPSAEVVLYPVRVQGVGAAEEIAAAIDDFNELGRADVLIVGRGGGSLEDLWAFNEESVARAVHRSTIPVVSAVGHEIDFSICDFVADLRAPTPSAAAELVVKDRSELVELLRNYAYTVRTSMENAVDAHQQTVRNLITSYSFHKPQDLLRQRSQLVDEQHRRLHRILVHRFERIRQRVEAFGARIRALDPQTVLRRGYSIVRQDRRIVTGIASVEVDRTASVEFSDGVADVNILGKRGKDHAEKGS